MDAIKRTFTPEFLNRLDSIVHFDSLPEDVVLNVVGKFIGELADQLSKKKIKLNVTDDPARTSTVAGISPAASPALFQYIDADGD